MWLPSPMDGDRFKGSGLDWRSGAAQRLWLRGVAGLGEPSGGVLHLAGEYVS